MIPQQFLSMEPVLHVTAVLASVLEVKMISQSTDLLARGLIGARCLIVWICSTRGGLNFHRFSFLCKTCAVEEDTKSPEERGMREDKDLQNACDRPPPLQKAQAGALDGIGWEIWAARLTMATEPEIQSNEDA